MERSTETRLKRGVLKDAALLFLSPVWLIIGVFMLGHPALLALGWGAGAIMLWFSRAWSPGRKLIGTLLSAASLVGMATMSFYVDTETAAEALLAWLVFLLLVLLYMVPSIVSVIYLWRTRARRYV